MKPTNQADELPDARLVSPGLKPDAVPVLPPIGRDPPASPANALTAVPPLLLVSFSSTVATVCAIPGLIRCSQARSGSPICLPSGPTTLSSGVGGQYFPPFAIVAYAELSSSGLVPFGPRVNAALLAAM